MAQYIPDPHELYEARLQRFKYVIKQYKMSKLRQINQKADKEEQFQVYKIKNQAKVIDEQRFKRQDDAVKISGKIAKSRKINQCKMSQMKIRFDMIQKIENETKQKLAKIRNDHTQYKILLKNLIKQGLIKLLEENVQIRCLKEDQNLVRDVISVCQKEFNEECSVRTNISISNANHLTQNDIGGIILTSFKGRIVCDNTFRARLNYALQSMLPEIRNNLFKDSDIYLTEKKGKGKKPVNAKQNHH